MISLKIQEFIRVHRGFQFSEIDPLLFIRPNFIDNTFETRMIRDIF